MLQDYFLAWDNLHISDKFAHCSWEKDEVYLRGCISSLVRDYMAVTFLETCILLNLKFICLTPFRTLTSASPGETEVRHY